MAYTFTERKRIRKSFGSRDSVLEVPYLLQMQKDAYTAFLQADVAPKKRTSEGLQAAFEPESMRLEVPEWGSIPRLREGLIVGKSRIFKRSYLRTRIIRANNYGAAIEQPSIRRKPLRMGWILL